jgi:hypothetical protein
MSKLAFAFVVFTFGVFFSTAQAQSLQGVFMVVKGDIKIQTPDGKSESAKVGKKVSSGDTIVSGADSRAKIVMADKNVINISPDSKITIEKYENDGKDKKNVELKVEYGKIRASVEQKYDGEKSKFNIKTPSAVAGVRGTDFLTGYSRANRTTSVITFSGTVAVGKPGPGGTIQNPVFVQQGQMTNAAANGSIEPPKAVPKDELNKMNSETNAGPNSSDSAKDSSSNNSSDKKDEKAEDKKDEPKSDDKKSDDKKTEEPKKDEAKREEPKKDEPKKDQVADKQPDQGNSEKREPSSGDSANRGEANGSQPKGPNAGQGTNSDSSGPNAGPGGSGTPGTPAARSPASAMPGMGMINMNDLPTAPGGGAMPKMPTSGPVVPIMMPPTIAPTMPTYLPPPPVSGRVKVNIILNPQ